jgi:ribonuclease BN (tRNA processing enzyme)
VKIRILGAHGSDLRLDSGNTVQRCSSVGFLVDDQLMVDAGTAASALTLDQQQQIKFVFLSHFHLDHIKELPTLADNLSGVVKVPITVGGILPVLQGLKTYLFNDKLYPNFFNLAPPEISVLKEQILELDKESRIGDLKITPILVNHTVPTAGLIIEDGQSALVYSADTYETDKIWAIASQIPNLKAVFIETSFPNEMPALARASKHLTPALLNIEFKKIGKPDLPLFIFHLKPPFRDRIKMQLADLAISNLTVLEEGQIVEI